MKLTFGIISLCLLALLKNVKSEKESFIERSFRILHSEPPLPEAIVRASVQTLWIEQKLDHFDENNKQTWKMRYMANDEFFQPGAPVFIYVGGEWAIRPNSISTGHIYDMAKEHKGFLFYTEHRYYGESHPTSDRSIDNLKYLHIKQALADLAHFIRTMKTTISGMAESKFILAGGSYSATMVTWFKKLYPDLVVGCWASSAPLFAKLNFVEYKEVSGASIRKIGGEDCYYRIQNGIFELESMMDNKRGAEVKAMLKMCNNFDDRNDLDVWTLFETIGNFLAGLVQVHSNGVIEAMCSQIMKGDDDAVGVANYMLDQFEENEGDEKECTDISYKSSLRSLMNTEWSDSIMRQWIYQTCNEYGWYQTSGSRNQPFGTKFPLTLHTTICNDVFGQKYTNEYIYNRTVETNEEFGGLQPNVENVYWTHGELDPWSSMGLREGEMTTVIPLYAHCKDFGSISDRDTAEMRAAKERIAQLVREWVGANK